MEEQLLWLAGAKLQVHAQPPLFEEFFACKDSRVTDCSEEVVYDKMPVAPTPACDFPRAPRGKCWGCGERPRDFPWFIPKNITISSGGEMVYTPEGLFCDFPCAYTQLPCLVPPGPERQRREEMLRTLVEDVEGLPAGTVMCLRTVTPAMQFLASHGYGTRTPDDYRAMVDAARKATLADAHRVVTSRAEAAAAAATPAAAPTSASSYSVLPS